MFENEEVFLLIDNISKGVNTKPSSIWVYLEDEKGNPCPRAVLESYIQRYGNGGDKLVYFTCKRPKKHRMRHVINLREFLTYIRGNVKPTDVTMRFLTHIVIDALTHSDIYVDERPELLTQIPIKLNALFLTHGERHHVE